MADKIQKCPTCPKCSCVYAVKETGRQHKGPLLLNCGHTFCEACLLHLARERKTSIICPTCKGETILTSGESSVKLLCADRYIMGTVLHNQKFLLEQELAQLTKASAMIGQQHHMSSDKLCRECSKRQATSVCQKCDCSMCTICFQRVHSLSKSLQAHIPVPINEDGHLETSQQMCKIHENRPLEYYCEDDGSVICSRCVIVGTHKGHNICSIEDKNRSIVSEMEPNLQMANHVFRRLKKIDKELSMLVPDFRKEIMPVLEDMRSHFNHLIGLLQVREHCLEQQVLHVVRQGLQPFEHMKEDLHKEFKQLDQTIKAAQRIINNNDEIIVNAREILDRLVHAKDIPCIIELNSNTEASENLQFVEGSSINTLLLEYGAISGRVPQCFTVHTLREKPEKFSEGPDSGVTTPADSETLSIASETTSQSDDVIIEEEQEILLDDLREERHTEPVKQKKRAPTTHKSLPQKTKFKGQNEKVTVTHIISPHKFMVQLKKDMSKLSVLSHTMQQFCNSSSSKSHMVTGVDVDDIVLAQYSADNQWYRGRVRHVIEPSDGDFNTTNVEIVYIDFGNSELVNVLRLRNMQAKFMKHPEFSIECSLFNICPREKAGSWSVGTTKAFASMVENKDMWLTVVREENNVLLVDLSKPPDDDISDDRPVSVRDALVFMELANLESPHSLPEPGSAHGPKRTFLTSSPKEEGQIYSVIVSYAGTPDCFYVQELGDELNYLATMMALLQDTYTKQMKDTWQIICPTVGMICVSQFSGDGLWYRARIVELPGHQDIVVQYVDYGNMETVNIRSLRKIIDSSIILPAQAIQCALTDVEPLNANEGWREESLHYWSEKVTMQKFNMKVLGKSRQLSVVLRDLYSQDDSDSVNVKLVEDGMGRSVGRWSEPQNLIQLVEDEVKDVVPRLSYTASDSMFPEPCDLEHQPVYWKSRNARPTRRYEETVLTPPSSPVPDRSSKSREIQPKPVRGTGDGRTVAQAIASSSPNPEPSLSREKMLDTEKLVEKSESATAKKSASSKKQRSPKQVSKQQSPNLPDSKAVNMKSKEEKTKKFEEDLSKKAKEEKVKKFEVEVKVSHFLSPFEFYLQLASTKDELDSLMSDIDQTYHNSVMNMVNWTSGNYCVAYSPSAGRWYRVKVTKVIQKSLMEVYMLDYGFSEMVSTSNLRPVMKQFRKSRAFCFKCTLAGVTPAGGMKEWSKTACEYMEDQITNKKLYLNQRGTPIDGMLPCDLIMEEYVEETALEPGRKTFHSLLDRMKEKGLAIPLPKKRNETQDEQKVFPVCYYKKAEAEVKTGDKVMPVYVDYNAVIHCYTMEGDDMFQSMCDMLHQKFNNSAVECPDQTYIKGQACAAFYDKDGQWHRASVLELEPARAKVHFIDYGNLEWVGYEEMRADVEEFTELPQQTFLCTLHDVRPMTEDGNWDLSTVEYMHRELVNKYCLITVMEKNGYMNEHMTVNLELHGKDFATQLVQYGFAQRGEYITDQETQSLQTEHILRNSNPYTPMTVPAAGKLLPVRISHVELPNVVYIQPMKVEITHEMEPEHRSEVEKCNTDVEKLQKLTEDLYHAAPTLPGIHSPKPGLPCCAQFGYDQCWYRAVIIMVYPETEQILVLFVDYGNSEFVTLNKLRTIPPRFLPLPCQSVRCTLADLKPPDSVVSWTKNSLLEMMACIANKLLLAKFVESQPVTIELYEGSEDNGFVYQPVIDAGYIQLDTSAKDAPKMKSFEPKRNGQVQVKGEEVTVNVNKEVKVTVTRDEVKVNVPSIKVTSALSATEDDVSEASVATVSSVVEKSSKSWADMTEEGSSVDLNDLPEFEDSDQDLGAMNAKSVSDEKTNKEMANKQERDETNNALSQEGKNGRSSVPSGYGSRKDKISAEQKRRIRESRKVEAVQHDDECFD